MVKAYFKYNYATLIAALSSNQGFIQNGEIVYSAVDQTVVVLNLKTQQILRYIYLEDKNVEVSAIASFDNLLAVGYTDGELALFDGTLLLCRLFNHQSAITKLLFLNQTLLLSASQDTTICSWDLVDQSLSLRLLGHTNAITGLGVIALEDEGLGGHSSFVVSAAKDGLLKVWDLTLEESVATVSSLHSEITAFTIHEQFVFCCTNSEEVVIKELHLKNHKVEVAEAGVLKRQSFSRVIQCELFNGRLFMLNNDKKIEVYRQKSTKKLKQIGDQSLLGPTFVYANVISNTVKSNCFAILEAQNQQMKIVVFAQDNQIQIKMIGLDCQETSSQSISFTSGPIRAMCLTTNDVKLLALTSKKCVLFDCESNQKIQDFSTATEFTSLALLPKNRYYLLGDDKGVLHLMDMQVNEELYSTKIHNGSINNIVVHENCAAFKGLVVMTTEIEKKINFLELYYKQKVGALELIVVSSVHLKENIRNAIFSNNAQFYAVSLYNNMVQIYYTDSHKLYLELYGHSLPVLTMAYTTDDTIILSGGVDKSIKIWATDFGNCKKTLKGHQGEVVVIKAVNETHYFFSAAKDNTVKYWDGDTFQLVMQFEHSLQSITSLAVGQIGDLFYVGSKNGVIRKYCQTKEQVFVSDEEERRAQEQLLGEIQQKNKQAEGFKTSGDQIVQDISTQQISREKLYEAEELMDLLEKIRKHREEEEMGEQVDNYKFGDKDPAEVLFQLLDKSQLPQLLRFLHHQHYKVLVNEMSKETACKRYPHVLSNILNYVYNKFDGYGVDSHELRMKILNIRGSLQAHYKKEKKQVGYNVDIMQVWLQDLEKQNEEFIFE